MKHIFAWPEMKQSFFVVERGGYKLKKYEATLNPVFMTGVLLMYITLFNTISVCINILEISLAAIFKWLIWNTFYLLF